MLTICIYDGIHFRGSVLNSRKQIPVDIAVSNMSLPVHSFNWYILFIFKAYSIVTVDILYFGKTISSTTLLYLADRDDITVIVIKQTNYLNFTATNYKILQIHM